MEQELKGHGRYWVLFHNPLPEAGDRVAAALVIEAAKGRATVNYDPTFAKIAKLFPNTDRQALAFFLDSIQADVSGAGEIETILRSYGPQLATSPAKRISLPVTTNLVDMLMTRYLLPGKKSKMTRERRDPVASELEAFVRTRLGSDVDVRKQVSAREIFGQPVTGTKRVALAVPTNVGWTLIDGVDLNQLSPKAVVSRADDVSRTFWNYGRVASELGVSIKRVGVVLNGTSHLAANTHEAHDYALHRFETESDTAIDAASTRADQQLRQVLQDSGK